MENMTEKNSNLAIASFVLGCAAFASWMLGNLLGYMYPAHQGFVPPFVLENYHLILVLTILITFLPVIVLIMAVATHLYLEFGSTLRKGKGLAWIGFVLAAIPWIMGALISY